MVTVRRRTHLGKDCGHGLKKTNDDCCKKSETWSLLSKLDSPTRHQRPLCSTKEPQTSFFGVKWKTKAVQDRLVMNLNISRTHTGINWLSGFTWNLPHTAVFFRDTYVLPSDVKQDVKKASTVLSAHCFLSPPPPNNIWQPPPLNPSHEICKSLGSPSE